MVGAFDGVLVGVLVGAFVGAFVGALDGAPPHANEMLWNRIIALNSSIFTTWPSVNAKVATRELVLALTLEISVVSKDNFTVPV